MPSVNCSSYGESVGARIVGIAPREWLVYVVQGARVDGHGEPDLDEGTNEVLLRVVNRLTN